MLHYEKKTTKKQQQQNLNPACASHISLLIAIILLYLFIYQIVYL